MAKRPCDHVSALVIFQLWVAVFLNDDPAWRVQVTATDFLRNKQDTEKLFNPPRFCGLYSVFARRSESFSQSRITDGSLYMGKSLSSRYGGSAQQRSAKPSWMQHPGNARITACNATDAVQNRVKFSRELLTSQQLEK
ncbi:hypothetical protein R1flu_008952 [Riccia fluitans]|uniref:Uncharacterized protein n=1 Tax=Riccia fluitans TaxID=41844 RepID=A0ABD1Z0X9_9MARC